MARKPADPSARLAILLAAQAQVKRGDTLNMADMAKTCGMTARNFKLTIDKDSTFPIVNRGAEGIAWQFDAAKVLTHMIAQCREIMRERRKRADRMTRLSGFPSAAAAPVEADDDAAPLSPQELKTLGEAQMIAHKLKLQKGQYMPAQQAQAFMLDLFGHLQAETLGLLGKLDPAGQWPSEVRLSVEDGMRTLLVKLQESTDRFLAAQRVPAAA